MRVDGNRPIFVFRFVGNTPNVDPRHSVVECSLVGHAISYDYDSKSRQSKLFALKSRCILFEQITIDVYLIVIIFLKWAEMKILLSHFKQLCNLRMF